MKKIKIDGKLNLNKQTVSKLNDRHMNDVRGGVEEASKGLKCKTTNTLSYGEWCTKIEYCEVADIYTKGIFCVK